MLAYRIKNRVKTLLREPLKFLIHLLDVLMLISARILTKLFPQLFAIERDRLFPPTKLCIMSAENWITNNNTDIAEI